MKVTYLSNLKAKVCSFRFICFSLVFCPFVLFCLVLFVCLLLLLFFCVFWFQSCIAAKKFSDRERVRFDVIFPFCIENPTSSENKENTDSAAANTDTFDAGVLAGMAETVAICWGGIKDKLEKVSSVCVMALASRSAKTKALNLSTGRRYFFPAFFRRARSGHGAQCTRYLALHVRFVLASRLKNATCIGCISHLYLLRVLRIASLLRITHL